MPQGRGLPGPVGTPIDRRRFLERATGGAALAELVSACATARRRGPPNLLFIMADDLGYGDLSLTGRTDYRTPVLDALAGQGTVLTQAYAAAPVCTPTRVALMTGLYPARSRAGLFEPLTTQPEGLPPYPPTLPGLLKMHEYQTALIGKWHLGLLPEFHPHRHGFDEFYGFLGAAADYASHVDTEALQDYFYDGERPARAEGYLTDLFTERAVKFITQERSVPFFLNLQYNAPHWPWQAPGDPPYPDSLGWRRGGSPVTFARMVERLDQGVAKVLDALHQADLERETLVVFTSDNGGERFSHMGPFSHGKMTLYEGGLRVAAFARWPGVIPAGRASDQVCITQDWMATLLFAASGGNDPWAPLDGVDLLPALTGAPSVSRDLYWRISQRAQQRAMRSGDWKYLATEEGEFLFDLRQDPGETSDHKLRHPDVLSRMKEAYAAWEREVLPPVPLEPQYR